MAHFNEIIIRKTEKSDEPVTPSLIQGFQPFSDLCHLYPREFNTVSLQHQNIINFLIYYFITFI